MQENINEIPYSEWNSLFGEHIAKALWQSHLEGHIDVIKDINFWKQHTRDHGLPGDYFGFQKILGSYYEDTHANSRVKIIDSLFARYGNSQQPEIQVLCAKALNDKGWTLSNKLSDPVSAMDSYDLLLSHYGASGYPDVQIQCAQALFDKAWTRRLYAKLLFNLGRITSSEFHSDQCVINIFDALLLRYETSNNLEIQKLCAKALLTKGGLGFQREVDSYSTIVARYSDSEDQEIQVLCIEALFNESCH